MCQNIKNYDYINTYVRTSTDSAMGDNPAYVWLGEGKPVYGNSNVTANRYLPDKLIKNNYQGTRSYQYEVKFNRSKANWGEKIPYWTPRIYKGFRKSVGKYCLTWNRYFGKKARILNIVRHPLDVGISTKNRGFTKGIGRPIKQYKHTMPIVLKQLENHKITNIMHVQFELLVTEPIETLRNIYEFCNGTRVLLPNPVSIGALPAQTHTCS